jgi:hypothetical protein
MLLNKKYLGYALCILLSQLFPLLAIAQIENALTGSAVRVTCAVTGSSTQALALNYRRRSFTMQNKANKQMRLAFLSSGTALLDTTNSFILEASSNYIDSSPGVYTGRIVCMSVDASTAALDVTETVR